MTKEKLKTLQSVEYPAINAERRPRAEQTGPGFPEDRDRDLLHGRMVHGMAPETVFAEGLAVVAAEDDDRVRGKSLEEPRETRVEELDREIEQIARQDPVAVRLQQLRGIGPITATALLATIGDASQFANGRQMAASLGLTPKQNSSGGKERLLGISKRGDTYLRSLLVHGARAVIRTAPPKTDRLSTWVMRIATTRHPNIAAVALANKTARIAWAMMSRGTDYHPMPL